jgi:hypothetical protein
VIAPIGVAGFGIGVKAQVLDQIEVNIPYQFVVAGKTLPAGTYRVKRVGVTDPRLLILNSLETRATAIIHSAWVENSDADKNEVGFVQVGDEQFLSKIETPNHCLPFQCLVRKPWKERRNHKAVRLPRQVRMETITSSLQAGRPAGRLFASRDRRKNDRPLCPPDA